MRFVIQRVLEASVEVESQKIAAISQGLLILAGFSKDDITENIPKAVQKITNLRIFSNQNGKFDHSVLDLKGEILLVPQFTLYADCNKGRRPEFFDAMAPQMASSMFEVLCSEFRKTSLKIETGKFGADMQVSLVNSGPVTITLDL